MTSITRWVLAHKKIVGLAWIVLTLVGMATVNQSTSSFSKKFSAPGREGFLTNDKIVHAFRNGGRYAPLVPVVTLPAGTTVDSPGVRADLARVQAKLIAAVPGARTASFASTGSRAFVSANGRTTFLLAYPPPDNESFGNNTKAAKGALGALAGVSVAGAPVQLTGFDALSNQTGGGKGPGVLLEAMLGGLGALLVLAFVFASLLAFVPILMAIVSIMTTFLVLWGVSSLTDVSMIVEFLVALIGLGVAIDYSLIIVVRWREERPRIRGRRGDRARHADRRTGRRVQRHDRRDRPLGDDRAAPPVPALDRPRGHADPAHQRDRRGDPAADRDRQDGKPARLAARAHRRQGESLVDEVGPTGRPPALVRGARGRRRARRPRRRRHRPPTGDRQRQQPLPAR